MHAMNSALRRAPTTFQRRPAVFSLAQRCCSGAGGADDKGAGAVDRHTETRGAMSSYLKSKQAGADSSSPKPWLKNLKQHNRAHVQYFAADDPNAQAKAKAAAAADDENVGGLNDNDDDDAGDFDDKRGGRKSRRRRGDKADEDEARALDKDTKDRDDGDPKRGISPTVRAADVLQTRCPPQFDLLVDLLCYCGCYCCRF